MSWALASGELDEFDPHFDGLETIKKLLEKTGLREVGFYKWGPERCELGFWKQEKFESLGKSAAREHDLKNGMNCEHFRQMLGLVLVSYLGKCQTKTAYSRVLNDIDNSRNRDVYIASDAVESDDSWVAALMKNYHKLVNFGNAPAKMGLPDVPSVALHDLAKNGGSLPGIQPYKTAGTEVRMVQANITYDAGLNQYIWNWRIPTEKGEWSMPVDVESNEIGCRLLSGQVISSVDSEHSRMTSAVFPAGEVFVEPVLMGASFSGPKVSRDYVFMATSIESTDEVSKALDAWVDVAFAKAELEQEQHDFFGNGTLLLSDNALRDQYMFETGLTKEDLPDSIRGLVFSD